MNTTRVHISTALTVCLLLISLLSKAEDTLPLPKKNRLQLDFYAGPNYTFRNLHFQNNSLEEQYNQNEFAKFNFCAAEAMRINFNNHFSLRIGFRISRVSYKSNYQDSINVGTDNGDVQYRSGIYQFNFLQFGFPIDLLLFIPLNNQRNSIYFGSSFSLGLVHRNFLVNGYERSTSSSVLSPQYPKGIESEINYSFLTGYNLNLNNRLSGFVEFAHTRSLTKLSFRGQTLYSTHLIIGIAAHGIFTKN
ncbi:MAG: hypothetical protein IPM74_10760 [Crocinitomicaceae bacterium]|nr:hypothetical protein [Crocinitomicaceae bacterium]MBK8926369.1 hypothetical protein [Crocinitomicaceae bacterium]